MSLTRGKIDDVKGKETLSAKSIWNSVCRALLMSGTSLKAIANKILESAKKDLGEVLPQTEEAQVAEPTPLISPVYKGNPVVELGNKITTGVDLTEPQPVMLNSQEMEAIKNVKLPEQAPVNSPEVMSTVSQEVPMEVQQPSQVVEPVAPVMNQEVISTVSQVAPKPVAAPADQPVIGVEEPVAPVMSQEVISTVSQEVSEPVNKADELGTIPSIVPPTFATATVSENIDQNVAEPSQVSEVVQQTKEQVEDQSAALAREEASVASAIAMTTVNQSAVREPKQELQTPQEFNVTEAVNEEAERVSDVYIRTISNLVAKKEELEKSIVALEEVNATQAKSISSLKVQVSELDDIIRGIEEARKSDISKIKEALDIQEKSLDSNAPVQGMGNVR